MPMHHQSGSQLRVKVRALWRQKNASSCIGFHGIYRKWLHQNHHLRRSTHSGTDWLHQSIPQHLAMENGDVPFPFAARHFKPKRWRIRHQHSKADFSAWSRSKKGRVIFHRNQRRQTEITRFQNQSVSRQAAQCRSANLDSGKLPSSSKAMMSIRQKQRLILQRLLNGGNSVLLRYPPDLMETSVAVCCFPQWRTGNGECRSQGRLFVVAPQKQAACFHSCLLSLFSASQYGIGSGTLVAKNRSVLRPVQQAHNANTLMLFLFTGKAKLLAIHKQRSACFLPQKCGWKQRRRVFAWNGDPVLQWSCLRRQKKSTKWKQYRHVAKVASIAGAPQ